MVTLRTDGLGVPFSFSLVSTLPTLGVPVKVKVSPVTSIVGVMVGAVTSTTNWVVLRNKPFLAEIV